MTGFTLFEVSWEVCNKVGGIYTVLSTKAKTVTERFGDDYVAIGPWLLSDAERAVPFDEETGYEAFSESCRAMGLPVRVGRWRIPGRPRTILVEFSKLFEEKDAILSGLWEDYRVDSISGTWDYVEPVLFGYAAGRVIEKWWQDRVAPDHRRAVVQANEWMTGSSLLYVKKHIPSIGTVFTTHATMLGRALSSLGHSPDDGLGTQTAEDLAETHGVVAKHSIEGICARESDVFTTVSEITGKEAALLHERAPAPILPNGIDLDVIDELAGEVQRAEARQILARAATRFFGEDVSDALFLAVSGRYEFHNKGIDILLDALQIMNPEKGRRIVLFVLVPAGNSGLRGEYRERLENENAPLDGAIGLSTHNLFDEENDPVHVHCNDIGLSNAPGSRVLVMQVPIYLSTADDFLQLPYESVLRAMDLSCFPSYYEPWGYTPQESLAVGVPTITTDYAGFGRWIETQALTPKNGVTVLQRMHRTYPEVRDDLAKTLQRFLDDDVDPAAMEGPCRETAQRTAWSDLFSNYEVAFASALACVQARLEKGIPQFRRPKRTVPVRPAPEGQSPRLHSFDVSATLPEALLDLTRLSRNYAWSWDPEGRTLFEELSPQSWDASGHNPVAFLHRLYPEDLVAKAEDPEYVAKLSRVVKRLDAYLQEPRDQGHWCRNVEGSCIDDEHPVAYFCAEFGIHESLRIYSGGLGILAGDHLKSASDLNLPFVGVGLFYSHGYLHQRLSPTGEQFGVEIENDPRNLAVDRVVDSDGRPLRIVLPMPGRDLELAAWRVNVGRTRLFLLDADQPSNRAEDRELTKNLYGGGEEVRLQQEIILGRGGVRLLRALGINPSVFHMNEGHAAFLTLERVGQLARKEGLTFEEAREFVRATTVFTTHTPVPAGHDRFSEDLMRRYFSDVGEWAGVPWERFFALGHSKSSNETFNMTYLAMHFSSYCNGVSKLHGDASRQLLHEYWPGLLESEVPVRSITNGIHLPTWTHPEVARVLGSKNGNIREVDFAKGLDAAAVADLWAVRQELKRDLIERVREGLTKSFLDRGDSPLVLGEILDGLDENALLIGFARRFAPYKRAHLVFQDTERLRELLDSTDRPVRILVAGKAHPADEHGKGILQSIAQIARDDEFTGRVFFVENYDIDLARYLVQGVDVWLNNPTRMQEASGTSGMKAAANGGLNLSIGDGWWPEAYDGENGWLIADPSRSYDNQDLQDQLDASILYRLLEEEVVPLFFERNAAGIPAGWMRRVAHDLATIPGVFNTDRMVLEYLREAYSPRADSHKTLSEERKWRVKERVKDEQRVRKAFGDISIVSAHVADTSNLKVGDVIEAHVELRLGSLSPDDLLVEWVSGHSKGGNDLTQPLTLALSPSGSSGEGADGITVFEGSHKIERSGRYAYGIRVRARADGDRSSSLAELVLWA